MDNLFNKASTLWFCGLSIIPVAIGFIINPLWRFAESVKAMAIVSLSHLALNTIIVPVFLVFLSGHYVLKQNVSLRVCIPTCIFVLIACITIQYWNWGMTTKQLLSPDPETLRLLIVEVIIALLILIIGLGVITYTKLKMQ